jgi:hypothetical protein
MNSLQTSTSTSISKQIDGPSREVMDLTSWLKNGLTRTPRGVTTTRQPTPAEKSTLLARLDSVRRSLAPLQRSEGEKQRAARAVAAMLSGWISARAADPAAKVAAYVANLSDLPCWVVEKVCASVARGHVEGLDPDFPPSAARLHQLGEEALQQLRREAQDLHDVTNATPAEAPPQTEEDKARVAFALKQFHERQTVTDEATVADTRRREQNQRANVDAQERTRAEYAALGLDPPSDLALSVTARRELGIGTGPAKDADAA